ncbi:hypothetical protein E3J74_04845 [Candidatus Bathyarchaeota archaeon]|nr:MAG: hypothetical protein E3J74_04845 [Candidatus Bathyarchaeota archaeon]
MSLYDRFGNFFKIEVDKVGKTYDLGVEINDSVDRKTTIYLDGKYFSYSACEGASESELTQEVLERLLRKQFYLALRDKDYELKKGRKYCAYRLEDESRHAYKDVFRIFNGFVYRIVTMESDMFLCIDPRVVIESVCSIAYLVQKGLPFSVLNDFSVRYLRDKGYRIDGYLLETSTGEELAQEQKSEYFCRINRYRREEKEPEEEIVNAERVFPESRPELIQRLLRMLRIDFDVLRLTRSLSFLDSPTPSKDRLAQTMKIVKKLKENEIFPLEFGDFAFKIEMQPIIIKL